MSCSRKYATTMKREREITDSDSNGRNVALVGENTASHSNRCRYFSKMALDKVSCVMTVIAVVGFIFMFSGVEGGFRFGSR